MYVISEHVIKSSWYNHEKSTYASKTYTKVYNTQGKQENPHFIRLDKLNDEDCIKLNWFSNFKKNSKVAYRSNCSYKYYNFW